MAFNSLPMGGPEGVGLGDPFLMAIAEDLGDVGLPAGLGDFVGFEANREMDRVERENLVGELVGVLGERGGGVPVEPLRLEAVDGAGLATLAPSQNGPFEELVGGQFASRRVQSWA